MASTNIQRTHASAPTDNKKCTISVWVKRGLLNGTNASSGIYGGINAAWNAAGNVQIGFMNDKAYCWFKTASGDRKKQESTRLFRDSNAWYHFVYRIDTTQSTGSNRIRVYCNNEELTSWGSTADPTLNEDISFTTNGYTNYIGKFNWTNGGVNYFDGLMSHFHFCDGYSYAPTEFGETDSTTGEWKIKTSPSVNYGNNGYFILKDGNSLTDQSSNTNNWSTHNGTLTKTEDCPDNNFATYVPATVFKSGGHDTSNGNTVGTNSTSSWYWRPTSLATTSGKFYAEVKVTADGGGTLIVGITNINDCLNAAPVDSHFGKSAVNSGTLGFAWYSDDGKIYYPPNASTSAITNGTYGANDILMLAMDLDNGAFYIGKNGSWLNSGDPTSGSSKTGAVNTWTAGTGTWVFADAQANSGEVAWNFGNGYFKTTAVASAGTNASGIGIFEYDVPASFTAMSTKGLNE